MFGEDVAKEMYICCWLTKKRMKTLLICL